MTSSISTCHSAACGQDLGLGFGDADGGSYGGVAFCDFELPETHDDQPLQRPSAGQLLRDAVIACTQLRSLALCERRRYGGRIQPDYALLSAMNDLCFCTRLAPLTSLALRKAVLLCTPDGLASLLRLGRLPLLRRLCIQCCIWFWSGALGAYRVIADAGGPAGERAWAETSFQVAPRPPERFVQPQLEVLTNLQELQVSRRPTACARSCFAVGVNSAANVTAR